MERSDMLTDMVGWFSAVVLILTISRQVLTQWRTGSTAGVSHWLFIGQVVASIGFVIYSVLVENWVFVVANTCILLTAVVGQCIYLRNRHRDQDNIRKRGQLQDQGVQRDENRGVAGSSRR
jgi:MtN3 and saliva related transmembrane protein